MTTTYSTSFQKYEPRDIQLRPVRVDDVILAPASLPENQNVVSLEKAGDICLIFNLSFGLVVESDTQVEWCCTVYHFPTTVHAAGITSVQKELHYKN